MCGMVGLAAMTDIVDGRLARRFNAATKFGEYFDPIADGTLLFGTAIVVVASKGFSWNIVCSHYLPIALVSLYALAAAQMRQMGMIDKPCRVARINVATVAVSAVLALAHDAFALPAVIQEISVAGIWSSVIFSFVALQEYREIIKKRKISQ